MKTMYGSQSSSENEWDKNVIIIGGNHFHDDVDMYSILYDGTLIIFPLTLIIPFTKWATGLRNLPMKFIN